MGRLRVHRLENCVAPLSMNCSSCPRLIGMGTSYLRVIILEPDDDAVLTEIKRLTLCVWCGVAFKKDHP